MVFRYISFFILATVSIVSAQSFKSINKKANEMFAIADYKHALPLFLELDSAAPDVAELNYKIGFCYLKTSQRFKSLPFLEKADKLGYQSAGLDFNLGIAYHANHQMPEAILYFQKAIKNQEKEGDTKKLNDARRYLAMALNGKKYMNSPVDVKINNLGREVNTNCPEYAPVITADESTLIFTSQRPCAAKSASKTRNEDIFITNKDSTGQWKVSQPIGKEINSAGNDASIGLSADGQKLFVYKDFGNGDIYESNLKGARWSIPVKMPPPINSSHWEPSISITPDGKFIFFVSARPGGKGGRDIYCSKYNTVAGVWSTPKNLELLNTPLHEDAPFIHPDGRTLYFSSEGHSTMGGFDIFSTVFNADSISVQVPVNIGYPINTANDDIFFVWSADGTKGYFSSDREGGMGEDDIYQITRPVRTASLIMMKGNVVADSTRQPLEARITIVNNLTKEIAGTYYSNSSTGKYIIILSPGNNYGVLVECKGYLPYSENIDISGHQFFEIQKDFILKTTDRGNAVILKNVFFESGKWDLKVQSFTELNKIVLFLKGNKLLNVEIAGYTDNVGNNSNNKLLSEKRAQSVMNYLTTHGIDKKRVSAVGYGETNPIKANTTAPGRKENRRTELIIK